MSNLSLPDENALFEIFNDVVIKSAKELNDAMFQIVPSKDEIMFTLVNATIDEEKFHKYFLRAMFKLLDETSWGISKYSFNKGVKTYIFVYFSPLSEIKKDLSYIYKYLSYQDIKADCNLSQILNETICLSHEFWKEKFLTDLNDSFIPELANYDIADYEQAAINQNRVLACGANLRSQLGVDITNDSAFTPMFVTVPHKITKIIPTRTKTIFKDENNQYWGSGRNIYRDNEYLTVPTKYQFNVIDQNGELADYTNYITDIFLFNSFKINFFHAEKSINFSNMGNYVNFEPPDIVLLLDRHDTLFYLHNESEVGKIFFGKDDSKYINTLVSVMNNVKAVRTGYNWAFVLDNNNKLYGVGYALGGQFGLGDDIPIIYGNLMPLDIQIPVKDIICGGNHTLLLDASGVIWATGNNFQGQLGIGNELSEADKELLERTALSEQYKLLTDLNQIIYSFTPVNYLPKIEKISCGELFSLALDDDGQLWSTGSNIYGQLGLGHFHDMNRFTLIPANVKFIDVVCGRYHVLALDENNDVYVWGDNQAGQLGIEGIESIANPSRLLLDYKIKSIDSSFLAATSFFTVLY